MIKTSWRFVEDPRWNVEMGGGGNQTPTYSPPPPTPPDPVATAAAQTGLNINSAEAQGLLNNVNQVTPYGNIMFNQTGQQLVGGTAAVPATPATGGYWNGQMWVPTGGTAGSPATAGHEVPTYTATTTLSPELQGIVNTGLTNAQISGWTEQDLLKNAKAAMSKPLDLSWGNIANNVYGLERNTLDPYWKQQQDVTNQSLADQGLTPGSQGYGYQEKQFNNNRSDAYTNAMLGAQGQAVQDITTQYNSPLNTLTALRSNSQVQQPGVGATAPTSQQQVQPANELGLVGSNYATQAGIFNNAQNLIQQQNSANMQQQNSMMNGLFGLGGNLLSGLGGLL